MDSPLKGIKVIDLSRLLPGPFCSMFLADLGADILRIESSRYEHEKAKIDTVMRNKKHMTLNLDKQTCLRGMNLNLSLPNGGARQLLGNPIKMSSYNMELRLAPAGWGEHTEEILCDLGYSSKMIQELRIKGAI